MNIEDQYKLNSNVEWRFLEQVGANLVLGYTKLPKIYTVAARDSYHYTYYTIEDNGAVYCCLFDDEGDDMPEEAGCVRMNAPLAGVAFEPLEDDPNRCTVTMYGKLDFKQEITSQFLVEKAIEMTAYSLVKLRKIVVRYVQ